MWSPTAGRAATSGPLARLVAKKVLRNTRRFLGRAEADLLYRGIRPGFGLLLCLVDVLADLRNIIARRLDIDDEALPISCANNPPIRKGRICEGEQKDGCQ